MDDWQLHYSSFLHFVEKLNYRWCSFSFSHLNNDHIFLTLLLSGTSWMKRHSLDILGTLLAPQTTSLHPDTLQFMPEMRINLLLKIFMVRNMRMLNIIVGFVGLDAFICAHWNHKVLTLDIFNQECRVWIKKKNVRK